MIPLTWGGISVCLLSSCWHVCAGTTNVHVTTSATITCTCYGECGGFFRFLGDGGEATEKIPFNAEEGLIQVR